MTPEPTADTTPMIVRPPVEIFTKHKQFSDSTGQTMYQTSVMFVAERIDMPKEGGIYIYYKGMKYPGKTWPFPEGVWSSNVAKRITLQYVMSFATPSALLPAIGFVLTPFSYKLRLIDNILVNYKRLSDQILAPYYMLDGIYCTFCKEFRKFITIFLTELGIQKENAEAAGQIFTHILEFDNAYRNRIQDILSETTAEELKKNPRTELNKLLNIFITREVDAGVTKKFKTFFKLISYALVLPRIKKALRSALSQIDFTKLQLDDADRYHVMIYQGYNYFGKTWEEREREWQKIHDGITPPQITFTPNE